MEIEFIRSQVEPEIVDKRGSAYDQYGAIESTRAYKPGFGDSIPYNSDEAAAHRVSLIGA